MTERCVKSPMDMAQWPRSQAYAQLIGFIESCSAAVKGVSNSDPTVTETEQVRAMIVLLDALDAFVDECPAQEQPQRYGNKAYRDWYARLTQSSSELLKTFLCATSVQPTDQLIAKLHDYLLDSFGNQTRIDYGTGHEAAFVILLSCLQRLGVFVDTDRPALVTRVFRRYVSLCRRLQQTYSMEPAGSQGVWSLDDYQFIPFIWGSAQLIDHPSLTPNSMLDESFVAQHSEDYLFFGCVSFILSVKTGPFAEHSNQLWNISAVPRWLKVNLGLVKMYKAEILSKFPVIQHFKFCDLFPFEAAQS